MDLAHLLDLWHTVTRAVHNRRRLLAAVLAGVAVLASLHVLRPPPPSTVRVWVAARDLAGGQPLRAADVATELLPRADVPAQALTATTAITGKLLAGPMERREPFTTARLLTPSLLAAAGVAGDVSVPVRVADGPAALALVHAGDVVDIIATTDSDTGAAGTSDTVAHDVRVLATPAREDTDDSGETAGLLIVAASRATATTLAEVAGTARLSVAVRSGP